MTDLPPGWEWTTLGEVCERPEYGWTTSAAKDGHGPKLLRTTDISTGSIDWNRVPGCRDNPVNLDRYLLSCGDIVVSRAGSVGISAIIGSTPDPAIFASYLIRLRARKYVNPRFVFMFLQSPNYWRQVQEMSDGIAIPNINGTKLAAIRMPIAPLPEQCRIVAVLDDYLSRIDAGCKIVSALIKRIAEHRDQFIAATCTGSLATVDGPPAPPPNSVGVHDGHLPTLPGSWKWFRLGDIADVVGGITKDTKKQTGVELPEVPYLRVANVQRGHLDLNRIAMIRAPIDKIK
jgi:type I restriction enzyme S subunit